MTEPDTIHSHELHMDHASGESRTTKVVALTLVMMVVEIVVGWRTGSLALLADGWHMGTHAAALGITLFAYHYARKHQENPRFAYGTGKVSTLGGYTSAIILLIVALLMIGEAIHRLLSPVEIRYTEALVVAVIGLLVNLASALLLHGGGCDHHHEHHDHNLRAAYFHVLADALTSLLAIVALSLGRTFGWGALDPLMGIVGALVIMKWAHGLLKKTSRVLLDADVDPQILSRIREIIEEDGSRVTDLHAWRYNGHDIAASIWVCGHSSSEVLHNRLTAVTGLTHLTIQVSVEE